MKTVKLEPKTITQTFSDDVRYFSVHNLSFKDRISILFNKIVWFQLTKEDAERVAR